ncbi:PTS cellobiose transporter subunit IIC [Lactovum odontotermitis]
MNNFINEKVMPIAEKIASNKVLIAIRNGITLAMPLLIVGSCFLIISSFPIAAWTKFLADNGLDVLLGKGVNATFGMVGLIAAFGIANALAVEYKKDGLSAGVIALGSFLVMTPNILNKTLGEGIPVAYMGAKGLFVAMLVGIFSAYIFVWFIKHNIQIKLPDTVPPAVSRSFSALIPGAAIVTLWLIIYGILQKTNIASGNIHDLLMKLLEKPLGLVGGTLGGTVISIVLVSLFWFVGIHGANVVNSVISPIWLMNTDANRLAYKAGKALPHIITQPFIDNFVYMGGGGATLGLVIAISITALRKNSSKLTKTLAPLTLTPGIFNINEPAMFGLPIVLNFTLLIPFILSPVINAVVTYFSMSLGLVHGTVGTVIPWTMPPILSGFLATGGHISGAIVQIICLILDILVYLPFFRMVELQNRKDEMAEND